MDLGGKLAGRNLFYLMIVIVIFESFLFSRIALAGDKVIQEEQMSFEKCLNVISVSEDKLSLTAQISDISSKKREAVFGLVDGTLTITCDGDQGYIIVSTREN